MRILGRQVKTSEVFTFVFLYLVANYVVIKIQQKRHAIDMSDPRYQHVLAREQQRGELAGEDSLPEAQPLQEPLQEPPQEPLAAHLAGIDDLNLATEEPPLSEDDAWKFEEAVPEHHLGVDAPALPPKPPANPEETFEYNEFDEEENDNKALKTILFYNTFFTSTDFRFGFGHQAFLEAKCPVHTCRTTNDRKQLLNADAVVFHGPRIDDFPPPDRRPGQLYVYVQQEPHYTMSEEELPAYKNAFNLTMTHRADSDIHIPYGRVVYDDENIKKHPIHVNPQSRPKSIVWAVSHCSTPSKRELYVKELQKYIDIDIYGSCGDLACSKDDYLYCYSKFEKEYRFYMALENNYCTDYISEKVYRPLLYKMVPIVFGGGNYSHSTPPHSVINIADYPNPKDLAKYLNSLSHNDKAYNKYFSWKTAGYDLEHQRKTIMGDAFCRLCETLHDPTYRYKDYSDLKTWWINGMCDAYQIQRWRKKYKW